MEPIFLVGEERSGTTLLRLMLDSHPRISWLNEFEYSVDCVNQPDEWPHLKDYYEYLSTHRIFLATGFEIDEQLDYPNLIKSFLYQKQKRDDKPILGATCHRHYDRLFRMFPRSRFIYLIRDPRDVARSNIGMGWAGNVWTGINRWIESIKLWGYVKQSLETSKYLEIRMEELVLSPNDTLNTICKFIGVPFDANMLEYSDITSYSQPDPTLVEQWKKKLSPNEISLVESKAFDQMILTGYKPTIAQPRNVTVSEKLFLRIQDKYYRVYVRILNYGFWLVVADYVARKMGLEKFEKQLKFRFHQKTQNFLK
jgi:hypothetical protein